MASAQAAHRKAEKTVAAHETSGDAEALATARQKAERTRANLERAQDALREAERATEGGDTTSS